MEHQELHFVNFVNPEEDSKRRENRKLVRTLAMKDAVQKRNRLAAKEKASKSPISDQQGQSPSTSDGIKSEAESPEETKTEHKAEKKTSGKLTTVGGQKPKKRTLTRNGAVSAPEGINIKRERVSPEALPAPEVRRRQTTIISKPSSSSKRTLDALSPSPDPSSKAPRIGSPREMSRKGKTIDPFDTIAVNPSFEELAICGSCKLIQGMACCTAL